MTEYDIHLDDKFGQLQEFDVAAFAAENEPWFNQTLTTVNESVVRLGVLEGEFHWHKHEHEDEFFLVLDGRLEIEIEGREPAMLEPRHGITIPRNVMHRPIAHGRTTVLMVEASGVVPTGD
jgi:mannose-6-phosphate isomerase-like protein (cupin superfamily)